MWTWSLKSKPGSKAEDYRKDRGIEYGNTTIGVLGNFALYHRRRREREAGRRGNRVMTGGGENVVSLFASVAQRCQPGSP